MSVTWDPQLEPSLVTLPILLGVSVTWDPPAKLLLVALTTHYVNMSLM